MRRKVHWMSLTLLLVLTACAGPPAKNAAPPPPSAEAKAQPMASVAPAPCVEGPDGPKARVAGGETVNLTSCARPAGEWAAQRPEFQRLRPTLH